MLLLEKDGTLTWTGAAAEDAGRIKGAIKLPVDLLDQQRNLIDGVLSFAVDVLELRAIALHMRPPAADSGNRIRPRSIRLTR